MPDRDQLTSADIAKMLGVKAATWRSYVHRGQAPHPDGKFGPTPWWYRKTVTDWIAQRPKQGARTDLKRRKGKTGMDDSGRPA